MHLVSVADEKVAQFGRTAIVVELTHLDGQKEPHSMKVIAQVSNMCPLSESLCIELVHNGPLVAKEHPQSSLGQIVLTILVPLLVRHHVLCAENSMNPDDRLHSLDKSGNPKPVILRVVPRATSEDRVTSRWQLAG
jgi:hypothetical protein